MSIQNKTTLKSYFETGDQPTESNFEDLIDSLLLISGETMTGPLILSEDPTDVLGAVTKQYADALVTGLWDDRGNYDASGDAFPSSGGSGASGAILKGDIWTISVGGTLGTTDVLPGDTVRALLDSPGTTSSNWSIMQTGLGYTPITTTLSSGKILVGSAGNVATAVDMSGDVTISNTGVTSIDDATVAGKLLTGYTSGSNTALASTDSILDAFGKVQGQLDAKLSDTLASAKIIVGNGSNVATAVNMSGDVTISNSGVTTIGSSKVTNAMLAGSIAATNLVGTDIATVGTITSGIWNGTAIGDSYISSASTWNAKLSSTLASAKILVGNGSNVATAVDMGGDVTILNTGVTAIGALKVTNGMLAGSIAASKLVGTDIATVGTITSGTWNGTAIGDSYISSASTWNAKLSSTLASAKIFVGNGSNVATAVSMSGDVSITNTGATTVTAIQNKGISLATGFLKYDGSNFVFENKTYVTGPGVAGSVAFWDNTNSITYDSNFLYSNSKGGTLSVGTTATAANLNVSSSNLTSGVNPLVVFTGSTNSGITASTESPMVQFKLGQTYTWASGTLAMQRAFVIEAPTLNFSSASSITTAATFAITGAPTMGTNVTSPSNTNNYALLVQTGSSAFLGNVYFGASASNPTALADFDTSTTNRASLRIRQSSLANRPTTPKNGDIYHLDDNSMVFNTGSTTNVLAARLPGTFYIQVSNPGTISNTTTETSIVGTGTTGSTLTLPAGFLTVGKVIKIVAQGIIQTNSTPNINIRIKLGGTTILTTNGIAMPNWANGQHGWTVTAYFTCLIAGSSGVLRGGGIFDVGDTLNSVTQDLYNPTGIGSDISVNTTSSLAIDMTARWNAAATSSKFEVEQIIMQHL